MKSLRLISLLIIACITSCSTDEDAPIVEPAIVTIKLNSTFIDVGRVWAFVTDSHGDVISSRRLSVGNNKFTGATPDVVNVTLFQYSQGVQSFYRFTTYPNVTPNSVINVDQPNGLGWYNTIGYNLSAKVSVTNFQPAINTSPQLTISDGYEYGFTQTTPPEWNVQLHNVSSNVLVSGYKGDSSNPVYGFINDVKNGDVKSIDFNDLVPFDKSISLPHGNSMSASIGGYKLDGTKKISHTLFSSLYEFYPLSGNLRAKVGYFDGFDLYETFVSSSGGSQHLYRNTIYRMLGTINPVITLPEYDMTIANSELSNFTFNYTGNSQFQLHTWSYAENNNYVFWNIYSDHNSTPVFKSIPENIVAEFPALDFSKFKHETSQFYHCTDGYDYNDYFQGFQKGNYPFTNPEYYEVSFRSF